MIQFNEIRILRDRLVTSLETWAGAEDGLYRSSPTSYSTPSFTNTGMVLQAFTESRRYHLAHSLAEKVVSKLGENPDGVFPHEKARTPSETHVMCNSWAAFSVLDALPNRVFELRSICEWFLRTQRKDGSWALVPGEGAREPIVTAYAISVLQQFLQCRLQVGKVQGTDQSALDPKQIARQLEDAVEYLLEVRPEKIKKMGLFLWPGSLGLRQSGPLSLGTSALCMHVLAKWSRQKGRPDLLDGVARTFLDITKNTDSLTSNYIDVGGERLALWDQLHMDEGSTNYLWYFFTPISIVTLVRLFEHPLFVNDARSRAMELVCKLIFWIQEHTCDINDRSIGVSGGETLPEPKVWSTAQSVVVLSRVLELQYLLESTYRPKGSNQANIRLLLEEYRQPPSNRQVLYAMALATLLLIVCAAAFLPVVRKNWQEIEGPIWLVSSVSVSFLWLLGLKTPARNMIEKIIGFFLRILRTPQLLRALEKAEEQSNSSE